MKNRRLLFWALTFIGVLIGVMASRSLITLLFHPPKVADVSPSHDATLTTTAPDPREIATPHLDMAKLKSTEAVESHLAPVRTFFEDAMQNTQTFAAVALGWGSKWRLIADYVPYTKGGRHENYIRDQFEQHVFSEAAFESIVTSTVSQYLSEIRSIENQMLVSIRADVAGFPEIYSIAQLDEAQLSTKFDEAVRKAIAATGSQIQVDIGTQLVSIIGGEVLAQVAVRLGVSAGILGTGAASGWATLGIGVVVGIIVDQMVSWVWNWWADPTGDLASGLNAKLDEMCTLICDGDSKVEGLQQRLQSFAEQRAKVREAAILDMLQANVELKK